MGNTQDDYPGLLQKYKSWLKIKRGNSDKTINNSVNYISLFLGWLRRNGLKLTEINQSTVDEYLLYCNKKYARNTLVPVTINLRKFTEFLGKNIEVKIAPTRSPDRQKIALSQEEIKRMFKATQDNPLEQAIIKTLYYSGVRESELRKLDITDVDFNRLQIVIRHGKGDRYRVVNITKDCAISIQRWLQVRPKPKEGHGKALFISSLRQRISAYCLWSIVKRIAAKAEIHRNVYPHLMRISNITHMAEAGLSPQEIQMQSGHRDIATLVGYIQHDPSRIRKTYERVFEDNKIENTICDKREHHLKPELTNEHYKKIATQKYLTGEIDADTLHSILATLEDKKSNQKKSIDSSYA